MGEDSSLTHCVTGTSAVCPNTDTRADGTLCNGDYNTCLDGVCTGSICLLINSMECQCTGSVDQLCDVCCIENSTTRCVSTFALVSTYIVKLLEYCMVIEWTSADM